MPIGIHVSIAKQIDLAVDRANELGCSGVFQIFTCSPRRWAAPPLDEKEVERFREKASRLGYDPVAHMPYMPNLSSGDETLYSGSIEVLIREIRRCSQLGIKGLVVHFGSHSGSSAEEGRVRLASACRKAISSTESSDVRILLENSANGRISNGSKFEGIRLVLDSIDDKKRTGVCLDTCHAFAAGYDLRSSEAVAKTIENFDQEVGLEKLLLIHANDSREELGRGLDRHEHIGLGRIGETGFRSLTSLRATKNIPFVLETPIDQTRNDKEDLDYMNKLAQ